MIVQLFTVKVKRPPVVALYVALAASVADAAELVRPLLGERDEVVDVKPVIEKVVHVGNTRLRTKPVLPRRGGKR